MDWLGFLFWTVDGDGGHLLIWLNVTFVLLLEFLHLDSVVTEEAFENWGRDAVELDLMLGEAVAFFGGKLAENVHVGVVVEIVAH